MKKPNSNITKIIKSYMSGKHLTKDIATKYKMSSRQVYNILKKNNLSLSLQEAAKRTIKLRQKQPVNKYYQLVGTNTRNFFLSSTRALTGVCRLCEQFLPEVKDRHIYFTTKNLNDFGPDNLILVCKSCLLDKITK